MIFIVCSANTGLILILSKTHVPRTAPYLLSGKQRQFSVGYIGFEPWAHGLFPHVWAFFPYVRIPFLREQAVLPFVRAFSWVPTPLAAVKNNNNNKTHVPLIIVVIANLEMLYNYYIIYFHHS